jgi:hypothetical protein
LCMRIQLQVQIRRLLHSGQEYTYSVQQKCKQGKQEEGEWPWLEESTWWSTQGISQESVVY